MNGELWCEELTVAQLEELQPWLHSCYWAINAMGQRHLETMIRSWVRRGLPLEFQDFEPRLPYCDLVSGNLKKLRRHPRVRLKKTPCRFPKDSDTSSGRYAAKAPGVLDTFKRSRHMARDRRVRWLFGRLTGDKK